MSYAWFDKYLLMRKGRRFLINCLSVRSNGTRLMISKHATIHYYDLNTFNDLLHFAIVHKSSNQKGTSLR